MAMDRVLEIYGQKYEFPEQNTLFEFTDHNGKHVEMTLNALHDPFLHKKLGFTTVLSVAKWWVSNREKIKEKIDEHYWQDMFIDRVHMYFDYCTRTQLLEADLEVIKECLTGNLRASSLWYRVHPNPQSGNFLLLGSEGSTNKPIKAEYNLMFMACIEIRSLEEEQSATLWNKHYNYSFRMTPDEFDWFRSVKNENSVMFGMELEVSSALTTTEIQKIVQEVEPKQEPFFIFKQDSSITGKHSHALELVTVPCTPRYLRKNWKIFFQKLEKLCSKKGLQVDDVIDTNRGLNNGLHIHVSRDSFIDKPHYNKFLTAWNQWNTSVVNLFNVVSDRPTSYKNNGYCKINSNYDGRTLARRLKGLTCHDRMSVAHDQTGKTIEVRVYQGIFDLGHIMKCISFTEAMFEFCKAMKYSDFDMSFVSSMKKFVRSERKYAALYELFDKAQAK